MCLFYYLMSSTLIKSIIRTHLNTKLFNRISQLGKAHKKLNINRVITYKRHLSTQEKCIDYNWQYLCHCKFKYLHSHFPQRKWAICADTRWCHFNFTPQSKPYRLVWKSWSTTLKPASNPLYSSTSRSRSRQPAPLFNFIGGISISRY